MKKTLKRAALAAGLLLGLLALRLSLLPRPVLAADWQPPTAPLDPRQVARTEHYRGFFRPSRTFNAPQSRALLAVLLDSTLFRGDTTPEFDQMLIFYAADSRVLGCTDLELGGPDAWTLADTSPRPTRRGHIMSPEGAQRLRQLLR